MHLAVGIDHAHRGIGAHAGSTHVVIAGQFHAFGIRAAVQHPVADLQPADILRGDALAEHAHPFDHGAMIEGVLGPAQFHARNS
jgi:hypothetical protein